MSLADVPWIRHVRLTANEDLGALDPVEIHEARKRPECSGERLLLKAVLNQAMDEAVGCRGLLSVENPKIVKDRARWWFRSKLDVAFSWRWVREHLGLTSGEVENIYKQIGFDGGDFRLRPTRVVDVKICSRRAARARR